MDGPLTTTHAVIHLCVFLDLSDTVITMWSMWSSTSYPVRWVLKLPCVCHCCCCCHCYVV